MGKRPKKTDDQVDQHPEQESGDELAQLEQEDQAEGAEESAPKAEKPKARAGAQKQHHKKFDKFKRES